MSALNPPHNTRKINSYTAYIQQQLAGRWTESWNLLRWRLYQDDSCGLFRICVAPPEFSSPSRCPIYVNRPPHPSFRPDGNWVSLGSILCNAFMYFSAHESWYDSTELEIFMREWKGYAIEEGGVYVRIFRQGYWKCFIWLLLLMFWRHLLLIIDQLWYLFWFIWTQLLISL